MSAGVIVLKGSPQSIRALLCSLQTLMAPLSFVLFVTGARDVNFNVMLAGVVIIFFANVIYGCLDLGSRSLFLFLHGGVALFLLSRPVIGALSPSHTWLLSTVETTTFALTALYLSMVCLLFGMVLCGALVSWNKKELVRRKAFSPRVFNELDFEGNFEHYDRRSRSRSLARFASEARGKLGGAIKLAYIRRASFALFLICIAGSFCEGAIKLAYMEGLSYEDYYLISAADHVPWFVDVLKSMALYVMCAYLAAMPKKTPATICLILYVLSTVPVLIIGSRSNFVIAFLFAAFYYVLRSVTDKEERWITREVIVAATFAVPVGAFFMGMWDYMRADKVANFTGVFAVLEDAFYKQGVSFTVLGRGYDVNPQIQNLGFKFFTVCAIVSNIAEGFIGTTFFGVEPLGNVNSARLALEGSSYSHTMSYFAHPNYLGGEGYGSSYLLEWYADFGYGGIAAGSIVLAVGLCLLSRSIGRSWFWGTVALVSSSAVFHMPRGSAAEWISFMTSIRFWMAVCAVIVGAALLLFASRLKDRPKIIEGVLAFSVKERVVHAASIRLLDRRGREGAVRVLAGDKVRKGMPRAAILNRHGVFVFRETGQDSKEAR